MKRYTSLTSYWPICCLLFCLVMGWPQNIFGQNRPLTIEVSYFGNNFWNPGLKAALNAELSLDSLTTSKGKTKSVQKSQRIDAGFFADPGSYQGLFVNAGWQRKTIYPNRFFISWTANPIGLLRSFLHETYEVSPDGEINKVRLPGRLYFAPSFQAGVGRISKKHQGRSYFALLNMILLMPYNTFVMPLLNIEMGCTFPLHSSDD